MYPAKRTFCLAIGAGLAMAVCTAQDAPASSDSVPTFGVTVVAPYGFCGRVYDMPQRSFPDPAFGGPPMPLAQGSGMGQPSMMPSLSSGGCDVRLPVFERLRPIGNIYTTRLYVPTRDFMQGFPGVTNRFEWFAIDYTARFWVETPGRYEFVLTSDDGSKLYVDERKVIDNDCMHMPAMVSGHIDLQGGTHDMRVSYFQGPRYQVALMLYVKPPGGERRVFDTDDFRPPADPAAWKYRNTANLDFPEDPCKAERGAKKLIIRKKPTAQ